MFRHMAGMSEGPTSPSPSDERSIAEGADAPREQDLRRVHGARTRREILHAAREMARVEGLDGLTIGRLARQTGMSKAGLFRHFGSKEALQLATVEAEVEAVRAAIFDPASDAAPGRARLWALIDAYLEYARTESACALEAWAASFRNRPGPVRDAIAHGLDRWRGIVAEDIRTAIEGGELAPETDVDQVAFEAVTLAEGAAAAFLLTRDPAFLERGRLALQKLIRTHELVGEPERR
jgi:AcrR family transcriptional regulator